MQALAAVTCEPTLLDSENESLIGWLVDALADWLIDGWMDGWMDGLIPYVVPLANAPW